MKISVDFGKSEILEKTPSVFGNGAHVSVSKEFIGKNAKIIFGDAKVYGNQLELDFYNTEILEREIKSFGTGAHIIVPKEYVGKKLKIILEREVKEDEQKK